MTISADNEMIFCVQTWLNNHTEEKQMARGVPNGGQEYSAVLHSTH